MATPPVPAASGSVPRYLPDFLAVRAELEALPESDLVYLNVPVPLVVVTMLSTPQRLEPLREALFTRLNDLHPEDIDKIPQYARALGYMETQHFRLRKRELHPLAALLDQGEALRKLLVADLNACIMRGLIPHGSLASLRNRRGAVAMSSDMRLLLHLVQTYAPVIAGRTSIRPEEDAAECDRLHQALSEKYVARTSWSDEVREIVALRKRAFSVAVRHYERIHAAVQYVRWRERDGEQFVPSLYALRSAEGRARARRKRQDAKRKEAL